MYLDRNAHIPASSSAFEHVRGAYGIVVHDAPSNAPTFSTERAHLRVGGFPCPSAAALSRHQQILAAIESLLLNDDAHEEPISFGTLMNAYALVKPLPSLIPLPRFTSSDDGVISLTWRLGDDRITATVERDGYGWTRKKGGKFIPGFDIVAGSSTALKPIYRDLADFYGIAGSLSV